MVQSRSDDLLIKRIRRGDSSAVDEVYDAHRQLVYRVALGLCGCQDDAADVVQETFLAFVRGAVTFDSSRARISTWLYRVARNRALDRVRKRSSTPSPAQSHIAPQPLADERLIDQEQRRWLRQAVVELPPRAREVFVLRIGLGYTTEKTAEYVGCSRGAVAVALHSAIRLLQAMRCKAPQARAPVAKEPSEKHSVSTESGGQT